jgi:hypothetical protein
VWAIESRIRSLPVEHLRKTMPTSTTNAFVIQNDGDEFITRRVMAHFKSCESSPHFPIYTPATLFKRNAAWVQETYDMRNMPIHNKSLEVFRNVLWRPGPMILRYDDVLEAGSTGPFRGDANAKAPNFGLGAANPISTPSHPILSLLKHLSTGDSAPHQFFSRVLADGERWDGFESGYFGGVVRMQDDREIQASIYRSAGAPGSYVCCTAPPLGCAGQSFSLSMAVLADIV